MKRKNFPTPPQRVALFVTCMVDMIYPRVGRATVELLEACGLEVVFPEAQTCCGQPAFNAGYHDEARAMAHHFLDTFHPLVRDGQVEAIVAPSGSCVTMTSHFHAQVLAEAGEPAAARQAAELSAVTFELTEFLVDVMGAPRLESTYPGRVTYHDCCHLLRELGVSQQPRQLLANSGVDWVEMEGSEECCGFGGLFAVKNEPISTAMGTVKLRQVEACGAGTVSMCDVSCMTHLQGLMDRQGREFRARHIAEVLAARAGARPATPTADASPQPPSDAEETEAPRRWQDIHTDGTS